MTAPELTDFPPLVGMVKESNVVKEGKKGSWVAVAQSTSTLSAHVLTYGSEEGKEFVEVPDGVIQDTVPLWDDLVEGKFMDTAPHVAKIHAIVNKIWPLGNQAIRIEVFEVDKTTVKFRIRDANTRARILRRGMWNIANIPMIVSKWSPEEEEEEEEEIKMIPMWVTLKNVPRRMFSWKGLGFIASAVGKPKRLHPDTILCKSFEEAKIFVEADMTKELPTSHHFKSKLGVAADVQFEYPWLPPKCSLCSRWGHTGQTCGGKGKNIRILKRKDVEKEVEKNLHEAVDVDAESSSKQQEALNPDLLMNVTADLAVIPEVDEGRSTGSEVRKEIEESGEAQNNPLNDGMSREGEESEEVEKEWSDVSPTKQARSISKTNDDSQSISSPSRFAILGEEQDESDTVAHEEAEESEEGEILEEQSLDVSVVGISDNAKCNEQQQQGMVDGVNTRRISTRNTKVQAKNGADTKAQSTSNLASAVGKKRTAKKN
ncbi:uncharacterized protein LOC111198630 [Brassica napus]|uniref:uncharacterized protein LOC111198630 n=1 Tax=Brassica napus TaxID=3708 RepID=UPI0020795AD9|nr:uncharacterized protein LOC111198630 [Brassica napus]